MSIEAVIAQARRPGAFSERRRFTIARTQAIQKLRQFALADSSAYILELIQAAIGNGAVYIDIHREGGELTLAYIGGGLPEAALTRLFDYLFAAKDRAEIGPLRDLAHGVNAMLALSPAKIVIVSGDGTLAGTTRLELLRGEDRFDVGRPDRPLAGTFIRAEGMDRDTGRERSLVESRCRLAPIPLVYNSESLFGHTTRRIPSLPGYARTQTFDEGDLYGILGRDQSAMKPTISLLTRGVVIEEVEHHFGDGVKIGGVVNFDGLHKSADHARIVRDDRMAEMWLRLRPYALALTQGKHTAGVLDVRPWGGEALTGIREIRGFLQAARRVVIAPRGCVAGSVAADVALAIAEALDARVLLTNHDQVRSIRLLAGGGVAVYVPDLTTAVDLEFYTQPPAQPPARPWVVQPVDVPPAAAAELLPLLEAASEAAGAARSLAPAVLAELGDGAEVRARVYTPTAADDPTTAEVRLLSTGRLLHTATLPSQHAGHVVVAELPDVSPAHMLAAQDGGPHFAALLAAAILVHADDTLAEVGTRAVAGLAHREGPLGLVEAHRALEVLARSAVLQLRTRQGEAGDPRPVLEFALLEPGPPGVDLLGLRVLPTWHGDSISLRDLAAALTAAGGRLHQHADDPAPSLRLDDAARPLLAAILGDLVDPAGSPVIRAQSTDGLHYEVDRIELAVAAGRQFVVDHAVDISGDEAHPHLDLPDAPLHVTPAAFLAYPGAFVSAFDFDFDAPAFIASVPVRTAELDGVLGLPLVEPAWPAVVLLDDTRRRVHWYFELAHDFGVVGVLRLRVAPWTAEREASVSAAIAAATGQLYDQLLTRLLAMPPDSPAFARAAATMLGYAGRRISLVADRDGRVTAHPAQATADRVLALPLFPGRRGLPLAAWHLVHRFAEAGGDRDAALAELAPDALSPVLRDWLDQTLDPARITPESLAAPEPRVPGHRLLAADGALHDAPALDPRAALAPEVLATTLEHWLHALRTDLPPRGRPWDRRGRVRILHDGSDAMGDDFALVGGDAVAWALTLRADHWLLRWASREAARDRTPIAWLLLACYARVNEHFDEVTNSHEGLFQRAVADALEHGHLDIVSPFTR